jgi:hypothetical protein
MSDLSEQIQWLQEQIWELQSSIEQLQMENTLLRNDLDIIKTEGCWRFVENPQHIHKDE